MDKQKTVVITGANSGIGYEAAKRLSDLGYQVVMACRNMEKGEKAKSNLMSGNKHRSLRLFHLDLASMDSIEKFSEKLIKENLIPDILVNNAGLFGKKNQKTPDGFDLVTGVNHLGTVYLTELLLSLMKNNPGSKIINVSSKAAFAGRHKIKENIFRSGSGGFGAYAFSKLAMVLYTIHLAEKLRAENITVTAMHPGVVATNLWGNKTLPEKILGFIISLFAITPEEGAKTIIYLCNSKDSAIESGKMYFRKKEIKYPGYVKDPKLKERLMDITYSELGIMNLPQLT